MGIRNSFGRFRSRVAEERREKAADKAALRLAQKKSRAVRRKQIVEQSSKKPLPIPQRMQQRPAPKQPNPFAHRSDKEVFGDDEGLRLFDADKRARGVGRSTGSLFGI